MLRRPQQPQKQSTKHQTHDNNNTPTTKTTKPTHSTIITKRKTLTATKTKNKHNNHSSSNNANNHNYNKNHQNPTAALAEHYPTSGDNHLHRRLQHRIMHGHHIYSDVCNDSDSVLQVVFWCCVVLYCCVRLCYIVFVLLCVSFYSFF